MSECPWVRASIRRMAGYVPGEQPGTAKPIKLNTNENAYPPCPEVLDAIRAAVTDGLVRYPDPAATAFRMACADQFGVAPEMVLCGNGSDDLLTICTRALVGEGDQVRFPFPSYVLYRTLAEIQGATTDEYSYATDWSLDDRFVEVPPEVRLVYLPNPNSPSGTVVGLDRIEAWADRLPCPLLVDEAYADFARISAVPLVQRHPNLIVTRTLSKSHALAGLRFGYLIAQQPLVEQLAKVKDSYNCDALSIAGATAAIMRTEWLEENVTRIDAGRRELERLLTRRGFHVTPSQANFVWCTHPNAPAESIYAGLKARGLLVRYMDYRPWEVGLRITVGTPEQLDALDALLGEVLAES